MSKPSKQIQIISLFLRLHTVAKQLGNEKEFGYAMKALLGDDGKVGLLEEIDRQKGREVMREIMDRLVK